MARKIDDLNLDQKYMILNEIERMNLNLLRTNSVLTKTVMIYFVLIILSIVLFITDYFTEGQFRFLVLVGLATLAIGIFPILINIWQQRQQFHEFLELFKK